MKRTSRGIDEEGEEEERMRKRRMRIRKRIRGRKEEEEGRRRIRRKRRRRRSTKVDMTTTNGQVGVPGMNQFPGQRIDIRWACLANHGVRRS